MIFVIIHKLLTIVLVIQSVTSLEDINLSLKTVESLLKILSKYENDAKYVIIQPNNRKPKETRGNSEASYNNRLYNEWIPDFEENKKFQKPGRHILIKRLLPHGLPSSKLEYDLKYKTFYRPLVRVHKRKVLPKIETILNINGNTDGLDKYGIDFYDYFDNDENVLKFATNKKQSGNSNQFKVSEAANDLDIDEELMQPFATNFNNNESSDEASIQLIILEYVQKLLNKIFPRSSKPKSYNDVTRIPDKIASLRSAQKSGEENDPMAPGKPFRAGNENPEGYSPKPKQWIPHYPPWNFWTYKKTIYQDVCPKGQVKIANLCIWMPPH